MLAQGGLSCLAHPLAQINYLQPESFRCATIHQDVDANIPFSPDVIIASAIRRKVAEYPWRTQGAVFEKLDGALTPIEKVILQRSNEQDRIPAG
jgi:hypothetical protein